MERKVGEIFEYNGEWYQCMEGTGCYRCAFNYDGNTCIVDSPYCICRSDKKNVIFKKLEKVGEPYEGEGKIFQPYQAYIIPVPKWDYEFFMMVHQETKIVDIEVKQNKEDMEEKKLNLKEFDLEAAKAGKPVCTRDGRKARIICFDLNNKNFPIVAIINCDSEENAYQYDIDGICDEHDNNLNLMMSPEKKDGWIIIHKEAIYDKETAEKIARETTANVIRIQKIEWEE